MTSRIIITFETFETREELVAAVEAAQKSALNTRVAQGSKSAACKQATARRDALEAALIEYDTQRQMAGEVKVVSPAPRATRLSNEARALRAQLYQAGQAGNAASVARINRRLEEIYKAQDEGGRFL